MCASQNALHVLSYLSLTTGLQRRQGQKQSSMEDGETEARRTGWSHKGHGVSSALTPTAAKLKTHTLPGYDTIVIFVSSLHYLNAPTPFNYRVLFWQVIWHMRFQVRINKVCILVLLLTELSNSEYFYLC